ncbi:hypothetical protein LGK97_17125 [Clostridium sp. CS001]|uniref:hypothetical protein n=1 Tax=Clostridium sp. CS001 TaxID=2880648 RepID=UPI001CF24115|nr:hypothetical protein [Clostridium sp. CS001]MCB2291449.1 hypothetical protein [Clostridium sp. CS001]
MPVLVNKYRKSPEAPFPGSGNLCPEAEKLSSLGLVFFSCSLVNLLMSKFPSYSETSKVIASNTNCALGVISIIPVSEDVLFTIPHVTMLQGIYTLI